VSSVAALSGSSTAVTENVQPGAVALELPRTSEDLQHARDASRSASPPLVVRRSASPSAVVAFSTPIEVPCLDGTLMPPSSMRDLSSQQLAAQPVSVPEEAKL
jgi:hypothetical protein